MKITIVVENYTNRADLIPEYGLSVHIADGDASLLMDTGQRDALFTNAPLLWIDLPALLRQTVEAGRQGEFANKRLPRATERFQWLLAPALLCLILSFWLELPVRPRPRAIPIAGTAPRAPKEVLK